MLNKIEYLEDGENRYPMAFTLNVMEAVQTEYGSMQKWAELIQSEQEPNIKAIKFLLVEAINEGFDIKNEDTKITEKQAGRLITAVGIEETGQKIKNLISNSLPQSSGSKNVTATKSPKA